MNFRKHKLKKAVIIGGLALFSGRSLAVVPLTDVPNLIENIASNVVDAYNFAEEMSQQYLNMDLQSAMVGLGVDAANTLATQQMKQEADELQSKSDVALQEMLMPDSQACDTEALIAAEQSNECMSANLAAEENHQAKQRNSNFDTNIVEYEDTVEKMTSEIIDACIGLQEGGKVDKNNPMKTSLCLIGGIGAGGSVGNTMTMSEEQAANLQNRIITGATPTFKKSSTLTEGSDRKKKAVLEELRVESFRSLAANSLNEITSLRKQSTLPDGQMGPSFLETLVQFDKDRWGSSKWRAEISNVDREGELTNSVMPSELLRKMAVMDAFEVHMSVLQYKQQLRQESLLAAILALEVEPLK